MNTIARTTICVGDLIVAAFDRAALRSTNPRKVAALATADVLVQLRRRRLPVPVMAA